MTITASSPTRADYTGDGSTTIFTFNWKITDDDDNQVYVDNVLKVKTTDYTVSGVDSPAGSITFLTAPATGTEIVIFLNPPLGQDTDLITNAAVPAEALEKQLDILCNEIRTLRDRFDKVPILAEGLKTTDLPIALDAPVVNNVLTWTDAKTVGNAAIVGMVGGTVTAAAAELNLLDLAGLSVGQVLRAAGAAAAAWQFPLFDDPSDVVITSIASGEIIKYDGANYINNTLAEAGISAVGHTHLLATGAADVTATVAEVNLLDLAGLSTGDVLVATGAAAAAWQALTWAQINKAASDIADITTRSHTSLTDIGTNTHAAIDTHLGSTANPHTTTVSNLNDTTITGIASGELLKWDGANWINNTLAEAGISAAGHSHDHGTLTGLGDDDHSIYALLAGRAGGQSLIGGTASGNDLTLQSTSHATRGKVLFGTSAYDEVNQRLGIGTVSPASSVSTTNNMSIGASYAAIAAPGSGLIVEGNTGIGISTPSATCHVYKEMASGGGSHLFANLLSDTGSGTITDMTAFRVRTGSQAGFTGTISSVNALNLRVDNPAGTITTARGIFIEAFTGTIGTSWAIFQAGANDNNHFNGNVGIGATSFGTSAAQVLALGNGTAPATSPADMVQLFSVDISAGNASLGLRTEQAVVAETDETKFSDKLPVIINGTTYNIMLTQT